MKRIDKDFEYFNVGDYVSFSRIFCENDFQAFRCLSGDHNPLHHDNHYALSTPFNKPIVPMHLTTLPLSAIAGMMMPGHRSLYLSCHMKALKPIFYGDDITYSSKITAKQITEKVLTLKTIAFKGTEILLNCDQVVQVRDDVSSELTPLLEDEVKISRVEKFTALITGIPGEIASAIALRLARAGYNLILIYRAKDKVVNALMEKCESLGVNVTHYRIELNDNDMISEVIEKIISNHSVTHIIHAASPPIHASITELMQINYYAFYKIIQAFLPEMLKKQLGTFLLIGTTALQYFPSGWENYIASKSAAVSLIEGIRLHYGDLGINAYTFSPGVVDTIFSQSYVDNKLIRLLPEEVAQEVVNILSQPTNSAYVWYEPNFVRQGYFGFYTTNQAAKNMDEPKKNVEINATSVPKNIDSKLNALIKNFFGLEDTIDITHSGINITPGWNSLRHIELLLKLENDLDIAFESHEIYETKDFMSILGLVKKKFNN